MSSLASPTAGISRRPAHLVSWFIGGVAAAFAVAIFIRLLPGSWFEPQSITLALIYVVTALSAVTSMLAISSLGRLHGRTLEYATGAGLGGALAFDGLAIGFLPTLYGHTGEHLASAAAALLWGVFCFGLAGTAIARNTNGTHSG